MVYVTISNISQLAVFHHKTQQKVDMFTKWRSLTLWTALVIVPHIQDIILPIDDIYVFKYVSVHSFLKSSQTEIEL